jgi:ABC-type branched-subunit amino acid transport system substrate-binding protein
VFTNGGSAQSVVPPIKQVVGKLGLQIVAEFNIVPGQSSYRTEVARLLAAHPDAILNEGDPQSDSTFFGQLKEAGTVPPLVVTAYATFTDWQKGVAAAIGADVMAKVLHIVGAYTPSTGAGWTTFKQALIESKPQGADPPQFTDDIYSRTTYDACNLIALAMTEVNSLKPTDYNPHVVALTQPGAGKQVVHSYAEGVAALKAGHKIQYVGAGGELNLNRYHNVTGLFGVQTWDPTTKTLVQGETLPADQLAALAVD